MLKHIVPTLLLMSCSWHSAISAEVEAENNGMSSSAEDRQSFLSAKDKMFAALAKLDETIAEQSGEDLAVLGAAEAVSREQQAEIIAEQTALTEGDAEALARVQERKAEEAKLLAAKNAKELVEQAIPDSLTENEQAAIPKALKDRGVIVAGGPRPRLQLEEILNDMGLVLGDNPDKNNAFVALGTAVCAVGPGKEGFVQARSLAFAEAELKARMQVARFVKTEIASGRELLLWKSSKPQQENAVPAERLEAKMAALDEAQVDEMLQAYGIDPKTIAEPAERKKVLQRSITQRSASQAMIALNGCAVLALAEGDVRGAHQIGVVILWSPNLMRLSQYMQQPGSVEPPAVVKKQGRPLADYIPERDQLVRQFGVRPVLTENGERVLLSFGQAEVDVDEDADIMAINEEVALDQARLGAMAQIKQFMFEQTQGYSSSELTALVEKFADGETNKELINSYQQHIKSSAASVSLQGVRPLKTWNAVIEGVDAVGVVMMWSPEQLRRAQEQGAVISGEIKEKAVDKTGETPNKKKTKVIADPGAW